VFDIVLIDVLEGITGVWMDSRLKSNQPRIVGYVPKKSNSTASTPP
jgi:hypothetical protein|tara:strand:- start:285 stop:422 length:138 start_codon:yes stop_codon:yes gene_type:complete